MLGCARTNSNAWTGGLDLVDQTIDNTHRKRGRRRLNYPIQSSRCPHNNVMHAKPDLRVFFEVEITGSGSVITDVIPLDTHGYRYSRIQ